MKNILLIAFIGLAYTASAQALKVPVDTTIVTNHSATINGVRINYTATTGFQPVWDKVGKVIASLHYTYYKKSGETDMGKRPLLISFNGGPGSASVWMHVAYTGPKVLRIDDEGYPIQPYGVKDNPHSVLDVADILYVNPANTGYSRTIPFSGEEVNRDHFFGINADIAYLAEWLNTFVSRNNRWTSPKYIIGESYGGTRVAGLAYALQNRQWMYLNGVIMVSPADYKIYSSDRPVANGLELPYFAAAAWHHNMLPAELQQKDLLDILPEVEKYTVDKVMPAIAKGGFISDEERNEVAEKMAYYSGLSKESILRNNLNVPASFFWKELLRDKTGQTIGRLDSRYIGIDGKEVGTSPDYSAELDSWLHSFTPAINYYMREHLNLKLDLKYNMFGPVRPWNNDDNNTREELRLAMAQNPYLNVLVQSGYYDGATNYFQAKYTMWQIDPSGKMKDRMRFEGYRSGHMMYLRSEDLKSANDHLRAFIKNTQPGTKPAKY
ncbi:MAG: carboxypeptidase [Fulvivirga sp.]